MMYERAAVVRRGGLINLMSESTVREADLALAQAELLSFVARQRPLWRALPAPERAYPVLVA